MKHKKLLCKALALSFMLMGVSTTSAAAQPQHDCSAVVDIIKAYSVWSFGDVEASHVVGPLVAKDSVYHESDANRLDFANLSRGVSSYVGDVSKGLVTYHYDYKLNPNFTPPPFYTSFIPDDLQVYGEVVVDSKYIDFDAIRQEILEESKCIYTLPSETISGIESIQIEAGKNYLIKDIGNVKNIDIVFPEGEDTSYTKPTIINIEGQWDTFPSIYVNGEVFNATIHPENGSNVDFGKGTSVIWNAPNTKGTLFKMMSRSDILGHVIAPYADFVNETGGNLNGSMIVNNFKGKHMELHSFPFVGTLEHPEPESPEVIPPEPEPEPEVPEPEPETPDPEPEIPEVEPETPSPETPEELPEPEPELPELPEHPEEPYLPELPENPELPEIEHPELPELPENPELPELPENPELPEIEHPELPELPEEPNLPELPEQPLLPELPEAPELPEVEPENPSPETPGPELPEIDSEEPSPSPETPVEKLPQTGAPNVAGPLGLALIGSGLLLNRRKK